MHIAEGSEKKLLRRMFDNWVQEAHKVQKAKSHASGKVIRRYWWKFSGRRGSLMLSIAWGIVLVIQFSKWYWFCCRKDPSSISRSWIFGVFKKLLLKSAFILEMSVSLTFSKDGEYSLYFLKLALFKLSLNVNPSSSKTRPWVSQWLLLAIGRASFIHAAAPVSARSSLIVGFPRR